MGKYLVVNAGSSSLKFSLYNMPNKKEIINGNIERIGEKVSSWSIKKNGKKISEKCIVKNHNEAVECMLNILLVTQSIYSLNEINGVGHRILHGGEIYSESVIIDDEVIANIKELTPLGPIHHPGELLGIEAMKEALPNTPMVAVFDTAFHQTMPKKNYMYPVPMDWYKEYGVRKYGFHGTSHKYITGFMKEKLNKENVNLIICHIGNGASISAIKDGLCYDTTMGLTPLDGLMMGTRSGSIDPSILEYVCKESGMTIEQVTSDLNKKSGLLGIAGVSDFRDVEGKCISKDENAILALDMYTDRVSKSIVEYYLELEGKVDAIVFTAGVGENASKFRKSVINKIKWVMPTNINEKANDQIVGFKEQSEGIISTSNSIIPILVVPTNEEKMILEDTYKLVNMTKHKQKIK